MITSRGAKSGKLRKNPGHARGEGRRVRRRGLEGRRAHASVWYFNFLAHPVVQLQDGPVPHLYRARLAEGDERAVWEHWGAVRALEGAERAEWWERSVAQ